MSAAATLERVEERPVRSPFDDGATLEDAIRAAWDELVADGRCACPVCGGEIRASAHAGAGECAGCRSGLS